jgi:hypothetical protein
MRRLTAAIAGAILTTGLLLTPTSAVAQVPRKCVFVSQQVSGELPGVWTAWEQTWRCAPPGPWTEIRYVLEVH